MGFKYQLTSQRIPPNTWLLLLRYLDDHFLRQDLITVPFEYRTSPVIETQLYYLTNILRTKFLSQDFLTTDFFYNPAYNLF